MTNQITDAITFALKLAFHYYKGRSGETGLINEAILQFLGVEKYKLFCEHFEKGTPRNQVPQDSFCYFKKEYVDDPGWHEHTLFDENIRYFWSIPAIERALEKTLSSEPSSVPEIDLAAESIRA